MKRRNGFLLLLVIPVAVLVAGLAGKPAPVETGVQITLARLGSLSERADGSGTLEGVRKVSISAARAGLIESITVQEGDTVAAGQLLLTLETSDARAGLSEARAQVGMATVAVERAIRQQTRIHALWDAGLSNREELTAADEDVATARAELTMALAGETRAEDDMGETSYTAPVDGTVTAVNVEEGEMAVVGTMNNAGTVLLTIEDMSAFLVRVTMVESEVVNVREGMAAEATLDALPDMTFTGVVESVGLASSNDAGGETAAEYEVLVKLDAVDPRMRSGMSASVGILTARSDSCVIVPIQSIVRRQVGDAGEVSAVLRVENGRVHVVPVETGVNSVMEIEVTGVAPGDSIVSGPTALLRTLGDGDVPGAPEGGGGDDGSAGPGFPHAGS